MAHMYEHRGCTDPVHRTMEEWREIFNQQRDDGYSIFCPECGCLIDDEDNLVRIRESKKAAKFDSFDDFLDAQMASGVEFL